MRVEYREEPCSSAEGRYRLTRGCIQVLGEARTPITIITRGPLIVRDIDVLTEASLRAPVQVGAARFRDLSTSRGAGHAAAEWPFCPLAGSPGD